ncbi:hypothetical protein DFH11DRAFT_1814339 [Phellopilus nigrolimitatus]|nr:hypothetical protein DFH11DRAFT_1814339 [Phellopilus nigrolimitatus]
MFDRPASAAPPKPGLLGDAGSVGLDTPRVAGALSAVLPVHAQLDPTHDRPARPNSLRRAQSLQYDFSGTASSAVGVGPPGERAPNDVARKFDVPVLDSPARHLSRHALHFPTPSAPCPPPPAVWIRTERAPAEKSTVTDAAAPLPGAERAIPSVTGIGLATPFEERAAPSAVDGGPSSATLSVPVQAFTKSAEDRRAESAQSGEGMQRDDSDSGGEGRRGAEGEDRGTCAFTGDALGAASVQESNVMGWPSLRKEKRVSAKDLGNDMPAQAISKVALGADTQSLHRIRTLHSRSLTAGAAVGTQTCSAWM